MYREAVEGMRESLGPGHLATLSSMQNLAIAIHSKGKFLEAAELYLQVLKGRQLVLGAAHPASLESLSNLASVQKPCSGDRASSLSSGLAKVPWLQDEVRAGYRQALAELETKLGATHPEVLRCREGLASFLADCRCVAEAEVLLQKAAAECSRL